MNSEICYTCAHSIKGVPHNVPNANAPRARTRGMPVWPHGTVAYASWRSAAWRRVRSACSSPSASSAASTLESFLGAEWFARLHDMLDDLGVEEVQDLQLLQPQHTRHVYQNE